LFITWDEGEYGSDGPIGMILLSPLARGGGYTNSIRYTHSSFFADDAENIRRVAVARRRGQCHRFERPVSHSLAIHPAGRAANGAFCMVVTGVFPGQTNFVEASTNLANVECPRHQSVFKQLVFHYRQHSDKSYNWQFYRVRQAQ